MDQLHRRFTVEQVKVLLHGYCQGTLSRAEAQEMLGLCKTRFFALLQSYRANPTTFSIAYERETPARLSAATERAIATELKREQKLVEDRRLPIWDYNYSALRDRLEQKGFRCPPPRLPLGRNNWAATSRTPKAKRMTAKSSRPPSEPWCSMMPPCICGRRLPLRNGP